MTAREKLKVDLKNPEMFDKFVDVLIENCCPSEFDYLKDPGDCGASVTECCRCWNREIPENAEIKELNDALNDIKKQVAIACQVPEKMLDAPDPISPEVVLGQKIIRDDITKIEKFDYKAGFERLQDSLEEKRAEIRDLEKKLEKQERLTEYWVEKAKRYAVVVKTVEAILGRRIIEEDGECHNGT